MTLIRYARIKGTLVALVPVKPTDVMIHHARFGRHAHEAKIGSGITNDDEGPMPYFGPGLASDTWGRMLQNAPAVEMPTVIGRRGTREFAYREIEFLEDLPK